MRLLRKYKFPALFLCVFVLGVVNIYINHRLPLPQKQVDRSSSHIPRPSVDPNVPDLSHLPDYPITDVPEKLVSVNFVIEHRSSLNGKQLTVRAYIYHTANGYILTNTKNASRNTDYDLRLELHGDKTYTDGETVIIAGSVYGDSAYVFLHQTAI